MTSLFNKIRPRLNFAASESIVTNIMIGGAALSCHGLYTFVTKTEDTIQVEDKYTMVTDGFTNFMVVDDKQKHYRVNTSIWFWKWDAIEDWHGMQKGKTYAIKSYGIRFPVFGFFPNIVKVV